MHCGNPEIAAGTARSQVSSKSIAQLPTAKMTACLARQQQRRRAACLPASGGVYSLRLFVRVCAEGRFKVTGDHVPRHVDQPASDVNNLYRARSDAGV